MNASDAQQARLKLELRPVDLAVELGTTPDAVTAWEEGRIRVPKHAADLLQWRMAGLERAQALENSGLPECGWIRSFQARAAPENMKAHARQVDELNAHVSNCEVCTAREAYLAERFPPMPRAPVRGWLAVVVPIMDRIARLPAWAQPAAMGAVLFAAYSLFRVLFLLPSIARDPLRGSLTALSGVTLSASIGAALGLLYGLYRRFRDGRSAAASPNERGS
jgi:hypothetical protein